MADLKPAAEAAPSAEAAASAPKNTGNPAFRAMGLPQIRRRLPSRNWMIFFGIIGSFSGAVIYDRRERRRIQQRYCDAVSHLADEQLGPNTMPRKIRIFLEAPPGDYLMSARDYFKEYIKPILVASALDWEVFEGRKEGDVRYKLAETIRETRRRAGEVRKDGSQTPDVDDIIEELRQRTGIQKSTERGGDLVIGRHTWKEYIRGLHEGWLGPLDAPYAAAAVSTAGGASVTGEGTSSDVSGNPGQISDIASEVVKSSPTVQSALTGSKEGAEDATNSSSDSGTPLDDASPTADPGTEKSEEPKKEEKKEEKPAEPDLTLPYIHPSAYTSSTLSPNVPNSFQPVVTVGFPHLLGFLNTPIRVWRFLHRRRIAESTGATVTAFILASDENVRQFDESIPTPSTTSPEDSADPEDASRPELDRLLRHEEREWHKSARKPNPEGEEDKERPWQEDMVTEPSLTSRMRTVDVASFMASASPLAERISAGSAGPTDLAGSAVASAAGNVLAGSSGGESSGAEEAEGPRQLGWKGGADRMDSVSWTDFSKGLVGMETGKRVKPWEHGNAGDEDS